MDDLLRDNEAARHGIYHIPSQFVKPGPYRVRGLARKPVELHYEFSGYMSGNPPWPTPDHTGGWTTNHTPPQAALFVPGEKPLVYLGSYVAEGGDYLDSYRVHWQRFLDYVDGEEAPATIEDGRRSLQIARAAVEALDRRMD